MQNYFRRLANLAFGGLLVLLSFGPALAATPENLRDIPNHATERGADKLRDRHYHFITSDWHNGKLHEYWWNGRSNTCVHARANDGEYESIKTTSSSDCNQYHSNSNHDSDDDTGAGVAIAAAAIIGAIALSHKSHHREDDNGNDPYADSERGQAEFERGYRDGLHHEQFHNYHNTQAYSNGFTAGVNDRQENLHHGHQHHRDNSVPPPTVDMNRRDDAATVRFRGGCEVLFAPNGEMVKSSSFCTSQEKHAGRRAYNAARAEKNAGPDDYRDI